MKIDGRALADATLSNLTREVLLLKKKGIVLTLAVLLVGDNPESLAYIRQKKIATERIGGRFIFEHLPEVTKASELTARIQMYNDDPAVHGLIVQRPLPKHIDQSIGNMVVASKDVDGFVPNSPYEIPIVKAVFDILTRIHQENLNDWLLTQTVVIIGRGETAGTPIAKAFLAKGVSPIVIHSQTPDPQTIMKSS